MATPDLCRVERCTPSKAISRTSPASRPWATPNPVPTLAQVIDKIANYEPEIDASHPFFREVLQALGIDREPNSANIDEIGEDLTKMGHGALAITMTGSAVASAGIPNISSAVASSVVLRTIDEHTPGPLADAAARLHALVLGESVLPVIEGLLDPADLDNAPDPGGIDCRCPAGGCKGHGQRRPRRHASLCGRA